MDGITLFYFLLGAIFGALCVVAYLLKRILNILRQMNQGEPSREDLNNIAFSKMKFKEK